MNARLLDLLEDALPAGGVFVFDGQATTTAEIWRRAGRVAASLRSRVGAGGRVGVILTNCADALAFVVGAWRAGCDVVSMPLPVRYEPVEIYFVRLQRMMTSSGCSVLAVEGEYTSLLPPELGAVGFDQVLATTGLDGGDEVGGFIQFTSGSSGEPKGVVLEQSAIAANIVAMVEALEPESGDATVSWLPMSHDMGLFGMVLAPWVGGGAEYAGGGNAHVMRPEQFLADPASWLVACDSARATMTACPPFALELTTRRLIRGPSIQLSLNRLSSIIVGAEPIPPSTLERFEIATATVGLRSDTLRPAYGLAENTLGVSIARVGRPWAARSLSELGLGDIEAVGQSEATRVVSCGPALSGVALELAPVDESRGWGEIGLSGPGVASSVIREDGEQALNGSLLTGDIGAVADGELFVLGRLDDRLKVRGQALLARTIEEQVSDPAAREGSAVAFVSSAGQLVVVAEAQEHEGGSDLSSSTIRIRRQISKMSGLAPDVVALVEKGEIPRTGNGKRRRGATRIRFEAGEMSIVASTERS